VGHRELFEARPGLMPDGSICRGDFIYRCLNQCHERSPF
jgi:hypothetical protein